MTLDNLFHFLGGAAIVALIGYPALFLYDAPFYSTIGHSIAILYGFDREYQQHFRKKKIWNTHRITEAASWGLGGLPIHITAWLM